MMKAQVILASLLVLGGQTVFAAGTHSDNSAVNKRDRATNALTADQQKMNGTDTEITARIRKDIMSKDGLSIYAQNVKIITVDGHVTVKGPVRTNEERATVVKIAQTVAGTNNVVDQTTVTPSDTK